MNRLLLAWAVLCVRSLLAQTPAAKAVVGRGTGKTTKLDGAGFDGKTHFHNFAVLPLSAADGQSRVPVRFPPA